MNIQSILPRQKVIFFDCYQTLIDVNIDKEKQKIYEQKGWKRFVSLLRQNYGINIGVSDFVSLVGQRKADFYIEKDKIIYHHSILSVISKVLEKDLKFKLPSEEVSALIYEYRKISRGYLKLHHPKVAEVLVQLAERYILSIASYTQSSFTLPELEELGIARYFSYFVFSSDIGFRKESPEFYKKCLRVVGKNPADCVMIGDNYSEDVLVPSQFGINTIWLNNSEIFANHFDLPATEAKAVIDFQEFEKLPEVISKILQA